MTDKILRVERPLNRNQLTGPLDPRLRGDDKKENGDDSRGNRDENERNRGDNEINKYNNIRNRDDSRKSPLLSGENLATAKSSYLWALLFCITLSTHIFSITMAAQNNAPNPTSGQNDPNNDAGDGSDIGGGDGGDNSSTADDGSGSTDTNAAATNDPSANTFAPTPPPQPVECFGIVAAGQNDNVFVDEDGRQYAYGEAPACHPLASVKLPADNPQQCENITVGHTVKGELVRGSLTPNPKRHPPEVCYPYDFINRQITYLNPDYATPQR